ncbi:SDR family oxidoreductase [Celeribacter arenosi]|uniref:SDR family oxidoreductase n=1 Tax=Celeribacter arenosi TaxID=792649 RepID=A0ABP7K6C2_9RHOB
MMKLDGKKILVTGGTRGIGAALVDGLLEKGCEVLVVARDEAALAKLAEREGVSTLAADLAEPDTPRIIARWVADEHSDCAGLINNAAIMDHTFLTRSPLTKLDRIEREVTINLIAPIQLTAALLPVLSAQPEAVIVNITSGLALSPIPNAATYCATKAGLSIFTKALRYQVVAEGWNIQLSEAMMTLVDTSLSEGDPLRKYAPAAAARDVLRGVEKGKKVIYIEKVKLLHRIWRISPAIADRIMGSHSGATA